MVHLCQKQTKEKKENKKLVNAGRKSTKIYFRGNTHVMILRNVLKLVKLSVWVDSIIARKLSIFVRYAK